VRLRHPYERMHLFAFGINHKTAPVAIREQAAFAPERLPAALEDLTTRAGIDEAAILSTCNRTEVYCRLDQDDSQRAVAPLKPAPDAVRVDTSGLALDEVVERLAAEVEKRLRARGVR